MESSVLVGSYPLFLVVRSIIFLSELLIRTTCAILHVGKLKQPLKLLTTKEVAEMARCSPGRVWQAVNKGEIAVIVWGKKSYRFRESAVLAWMRRHTRRPSRVLKGYSRVPETDIN